MIEIILRGFGILLLLLWCWFAYHFIFSKQATPPSAKEKLKFLATLDKYKEQ